MRADGASVTIVGRAANNPLIANTGGVDRVTLRVVATERRFDESTSQWIDGDEYGVNVVCWRQVAAGVLKTVRKGDPVVVIGRISTRKFERNGAIEYFTDVKGDIVGFDLGRAKDRIKRSEGGDTRDPAVLASDPDRAAVDPGVDDPPERDELELDNLGDQQPQLAGVH